MMEVKIKSVSNGFTVIALCFGGEETVHLTMQDALQRIASILDSDFIFKKKITVEE